MTASYTDTLPTPKDEVRFRLGDIKVDPASAALYSDEAIEAALGRHGQSVDLATSELAAGLYRRFAQAPIKWTEAGQSFDFTGRLKAWQGLIITPDTETAGDSPISFVPIDFGFTTARDEYS